MFKPKLRNGTKIKGSNRLKTQHTSVVSGPNHKADVAYQWQEHKEGSRRNVQTHPDVHGRPQNKAVSVPAGPRNHLEGLDNGAGSERRNIHPDL